METMLTFAGVTIATIVALFAALALQSVLLKGMFVLMQPLAVRQSRTAVGTARSASIPLEQGARLLAQAYGKSR